MAINKNYYYNIDIFTFTEKSVAPKIAIHRNLAPYTPTPMVTQDPTWLSEQPSSDRRGKTGEKQNCVQCRAIMATIRGTVGRGEKERPQLVREPSYAVQCNAELLTV